MSTEPLTLEQARNLLAKAAAGKAAIDTEVTVLFRQLQTAEDRQRIQAKVLLDAKAKFISVGLGETVYG